MKRLIEFWLLLLMVFWGSNAWADNKMTFSATSPSNNCNLTQLNVPAGSFRSIENGGITLKITAANDDNASWNPADVGSNHGQTIALKTGANVSISSSSAEMKITKIVFTFENNNKGHFTESSPIGGTLDPNTATGYVSTQTWSLEKGANSVSLTNNNANKAYITSIDITYKTGGLDNYTVQAYPYTWNFQDTNLWTNSESQFVSEIWTRTTDDKVDEWRNTDHEPIVATGYDVDLLRGLRFTNHVCADKKRQCVSLPKEATITIPSLHKGQKVKIHYTGVGILPTTNLEVSQERNNNIEIYKVTQDGNAILTIDPNGAGWGVWISQISVLNAAPVLTMTAPADKATEVDPNLSSITVISEKPLWAYDVNGAKTPTEQTIKATLTSDDINNEMEVTATFTAGETGVKELNFTLPQGKQLESATTYTLNIPANVIMETSGTGNKNCSFTFSTKGLSYLGAYNGDTKIEANPYTVSTLDNNRVAFAFDEEIEKTDNFKVIVSDGTTVNTYTKDSQKCGLSDDSRALYVPVQLKAGKYYSIKITAGSLKDATAGSTLKNNQIVLHMISSLEGISLSMTTPYNQDEAPLTTRIILSAKDNDGKDTNIKKNVEATLEGKSADGSQTHNIGTVTGIANSNKLVFTPKEGQQLRPNYTYTLKLNKEAELKDVKDGKLDDVTFVFTTANVTGDAPKVESTSPDAESTIKVEDVQPATNKQIEIKFNEDIQLLDGALIFCRPMGGSESYTSLEYYSGRSDNYNHIHADGRKLWFDYSGQNLFYGMRYEVTIPTYAIVGIGGKPMDKNFKFYFETPKSKEASDSRDRKDVYTWDFTNIFEDSWSKLEESATANNSFWGKGTVNNRSAYGSFGANKSDKRRFNQNQEIRFGDGNVMKELRGILFTLVNNRSNRFCICPATTTETSYIDMTGGTHYMTLQDVPTGSTIFVEYTDQFFNLNSINVDSLRTYQNDLLHNVSMYKVTSTGDVSFCFQNLKLYRIAIVKDNKTIGSADKDYIKYATYSQSYPVDYNLNAILNGTAVTAYSVSTDYKSNATFVNFTELPNNQSARGEGVILKTSGNLGESHPIFTTDVNNTTPQKPASNALVGTGDKGTEFGKAKKEGCQNYILTTKYFHLDKNENPLGEVIDGNQQCFYKWVKGNAKSNLAYLQLKNPSNPSNAKTVIYLDWFGDTTGIHGMTAPSQVTSGKTYYTLDGRKVTSPTQKGIYIINGKKIIIK